MIGYGAMLMEGLVGVVALIAAASLDPELYYGMNVDRRKVPEFRNQLEEMYKKYPPPLASAGLHDLRVEKKRDIAEVNRMVGGGESIRGRTGGAVTLAVGMALIFDDALAWTGIDSANIIQYWYHFAIMFEALFILTTIDTGTRIARFLLQETLGKIHPQLEKPDWVPGAVLSTLLVTAGWGVLVYTGSIDTIWPMFGIANQLLAVVALALVTTWLVNTGRGRYAPVTVLPMLFVTATTMTAGAEMAGGRFAALIAAGQVAKGTLNLALTVFVMTCVAALLLLAVSRWILVAAGIVPVRQDDAPVVPEIAAFNGVSTTAEHAS
jgi:carbon starvation protein